MKSLLTFLVAFLAFVGALVIVALLWLKFKFGAMVREKQRLREKEEDFIEVADWIGKTGLGEDTERELPRYLRRELGELLAEEGSLKAGDLTYLGHCAEDGEVVHYWHMPYGREEAYAYVSVSKDRAQALGWGGDRQPPEDLRTRAREIMAVRSARPELRS